MSATFTFTLDLCSEFETIQFDSLGLPKERKKRSTLLDVSWRITETIEQVPGASGTCDPLCHVLIGQYNSLAFKCTPVTPHLASKDATNRINHGHYFEMKKRKKKKKRKKEKKKKKGISMSHLSLNRPLAISVCVLCQVVECVFVNAAVHGFVWFCPVFQQSTNVLFVLSFVKIQTVHGFPALYGRRLMTLSQLQKTQCGQSFRK